MKPIIVGVDPGTYIGIAIFDLNGNLMYSSTIMDKGKEEAVTQISNHGNPIVVASDVNPPPQFVTQIASYFNARLFYPKSTISDLSKTVETSKYKFSSVHERDAIIAVLAFFKENSNKLRWIERTLRDKGLSKIEEDVKRYALSGMRVDDAIKALVPVDDEYKKIMEYAKSLPEAPPIAKAAERRESDRDTIIGLLESNIRLKARLSVLEEELRILKSERGSESNRNLNSILFSRDMKIRRLKRIIKMKNNKIKHLYRIIDSMKEKSKEAGKEQIPDKTDKKDTGAAKEKDLKNEDTTLSIEKIVKEYRQSRFKD
ncbi:MAG: DUF460 domain-containing protein [Candidatus Micrarchaeota archaeon]|nr:DUF460 domain-containing protein [Candidatus Micrarchaeota archaeon]